MLLKADLAPRASILNSLPKHRAHPSGADLKHKNLSSRLFALFRSRSARRPAAAACLVHSAHCWAKASTRGVSEGNLHF